jgi:RNA polymerase sigma-70 factor (ECF subfamily)
LNNKNQNITLLLAACQKGNQKAQLEIYKRYHKAMYNTALRILNNSFDAEDVMQEGFLAAFTKLESFKAEVTFGAWLKRIIINASLQLIRKRKENTVTLNENVNHLIDNEPANLDFSQVQVVQVLEAIARLKENYRIAISLHLIEGYDYEEMTGIMETSYDNCRALVSRAKAKIRKQLAN